MTTPPRQERLLSRRDAHLTRRNVLSSGMGLAAGAAFARAAAAEVEPISPVMRKLSTYMSEATG
jgi:hypothetical protein